MDEIPSNPKADCVYLLSRPICIPEKAHWSKKGIRIFTSETIKHILCRQKKSLAKNIECIDKTSTVLEFKDGQKTTVRIHETDSASANLVFLFEYGDLNTKIIYAGQFTEVRSILINDYIVQSIKMQDIDEVLIDNTMVDKKNSIEAACTEIRVLIRDFKNYKIHLHVDHLGFEDMLMTLRTKYHFRVYIEDMPVLHMVLEKLNLLEYFDTTKEEAQIIVMSNTKTDTVENLERLYADEMVLTVKLVSCPEIKKICNCILLKDVLHFVHYLPRPSMFDAFSLVQILRPRTVSPIYKDGPKIPKFIQNCCLERSNHATSVTATEKLDENGNSQGTNPSPSLVPSVEKTVIGSDSETSSQPPPPTASCSRNQRKSCDEESLGPPTQEILISSDSETILRPRPAGVRRRPGIPFTESTSSSEIVLLF